MLHSVTKDQVDIYKLPEVNYQAKANTQLTVGDLHGNAMKLLYLLVWHGTASNITEDQYATLVEIYTKNPNDLHIFDLEVFKSILNGMVFNSATAIRLIGDELADRGSNDFFTLLILNKLQENNVPVEIIISNHSVEFIQAYEKYKTTNHFHAPMLPPKFAASLENLNTLVQKEIVYAEEVLELVESAYKPYLKAISWSLNEDNSEITIYSHAGIGLNTIKGLAKQFKVPYMDSTAVQLAETIDRINRKFGEHVQQGTVHTQCPEGAMDAGYGGYADLSDTPLVCAMWNRNYNAITRPVSQNGYSLVYVHGHDARDPLQEKAHVINLDVDNDLGKLSDLNKGIYPVLSTDFCSVRLTANLEIAPLTDKINKELTRLQSSLSSNNNFLVNLGLIRSSDAKYQAFKELGTILQNCAPSNDATENSADAFYDKLWQWKKNNEVCIAKHRNSITRFFRPEHKPQSASVVEEVFCKLGL